MKTFLQALVLLLLISPFGYCQSPLTNDSLSRFLDDKWDLISYCGGFTTVKGCTKSNENESILFDKIGTQSDSLMVTYFQNGTISNKGKIYLYHSKKSPALNFYYYRWAGSPKPDSAGIEMMLSRVTIIHPDSMLVKAERCPDCPDVKYARSELVTSSEKEIEKSESKIEIFPNPTKESFQFESTTKYTSIVIKNLSGVQLITLTGDTKSINISTLEPGIYIVSFQSVDGIVTKSIVKE